MERSSLLRGGRAADQQRNGEIQTLHLLGHGDHLVERRGDQARETDELRVLLLGDLENLVARRHHAQIDHTIVIAAENNTHDVLANVMDVTYRRQRAIQS